MEFLQDVDLAIIGSGPAGLSAAIYGARCGLSVFIADFLNGSGQIFQIAKLENFPGIFPAKSGFEFFEDLKNQSESFGVKIQPCEVFSIKLQESKNENQKRVFFVQTSKGIVKSRSVIIASGAVHKKAEISGEEKFFGRGVSYCAVCDGPFFRNKRIFVLGGGDSAFSEALFLANFSSDVTIIHRRKEFRASKDLVSKIKNSNVKIMNDCVIEKILGKDKVESLLVKNLENSKTFEINADALFIFVGTKPNLDFLKNCDFGKNEFLEVDEKGYLITDEKLMTNISGIFAAGDVRTKEIRQVVTAVNDGAKSAIFAEKFLKESDF